MSGYLGRMLRELFGGLLLRWKRGHATEDGVIGTMGERAAADYLRREKGYAILRRNWRHERDEIDLICRDGEALVFVEVKTRAAHSLVGGYHAVNKRKKRAVLRAARAYVAGLAEKPRTLRFDVVEVDHVEGERTALRHFENVPLFSKGYRPGE